MYNGDRKANSSGGAGQILVVRLGSMGDILHTLPAVASLKHSFPASRITWLVKPRWAVLLDGNVFVDRVIQFDRRSFAGWRGLWREFRRERFDFAVDFQGLIQSAALASLSRSERIYGYHRSQVREPLAATLYSNSVLAPSTHIVDQHLDLVTAAGAASIVHQFPLPEGAPADPLPDGDFVLASPMAGWTSKQWPLEYYDALAGRLYRELGVPLVVNGPPGALDALASVREAHRHLSGLPGLIHATRQAAAVVGVDSGPMHLAAALGKSGIAIFGPTDPARNGPYGKTMTVLRSPDAVTSYARRSTIDLSMRAIGPDAVLEALKFQLAHRGSASAARSV